jgi:hypothetical protein
VDEKTGWVLLELEGEPDEIERSLASAQQKGDRIEPVAGSWVFRFGVATEFPPPSKPFSSAVPRPRSCELESRANERPVLRSKSGYLAPQVEWETLGKVPSALVLQSWVADGHHHCRLFSADGTELADVQTQSVSWENGVTAFIDVTSDDQSAATMDIDYVRIFKAP